MNVLSSPIPDDDDFATPGLFFRNHTLLLDLSFPELQKLSDERYLTAYAEVLASHLPALTTLRLSELAREARFHTLEKLTYQEYLQTPEWKAIAAEMLLLIPYC